MPRAAAPLPLARRALLAAACGPASRRSTSSASTSSVFSPPSAQLQPGPPSSGDALGEHASPFALPEPFAASARRSAAPGEHELDILTMVREMEASGLSRGQAETVARAVAANSGELWQRCGARFAERLDLEKHEHANRAALKVFRAEMENRLSEMKSNLTREVEALSAELQRLRDDVRYESEKMQASTRLDLNLIKNNFKEEQQKIGDRIGHAEGRLERMVAATSHENKTEVQEVRTALEASKSDSLKFGIGGIVSMVGLGLTYVRFFLV